MVKCNVSLYCVKTLLNRAVDLSANRFKLPIYFAVGKPQYLNSYCSMMQLRSWS